jgi:hypothetical protein
VDGYFKDLAKASEKLVSAMDDYVTKMPSVREKLIATETQSSIEDGLNYTDAEIESLVEKQLDAHAFTNNLREAMKPFDGVMPSD